MEAVENYVSIMKLIPLEIINPRVILPYLPPGRSQEQLSKSYWRKVRSLVGDQMFKIVFVDDSHKIFEQICLEYLYDLDKPGNASVVLETALLSRDLEHKSNLASIALEATERAMIHQKFSP